MAPFFIDTPTLLRIMPGTKHADIYVPLLNKTMRAYDINTSLRVAAFLAQVAHESGQLNITEENLNYSAGRLQAIFPKYFPTFDAAAAFHKRPQAIANRVYAGRMGNGPEASGDGWKYRGRGLIQITGKWAYTNFEAHTGIAAAGTPDLAALPPAATESAAWFWSSHGLNELADVEKFEAITKKINGGINGLKERVSFYSAAKLALDI